MNRLVGAMSDRRHQSYIDHTYTDLIRQRVFQIACGYEDANDSDDLRSDPGLKIACERLPLTGDDLASQPTMSRLENSVTRSDLYRMGKALLETFIESYDKPPKKLILDIDDTDDPTHGSQQLTLFHAYYDEYCYLPIHLYEGETGKLITTLLRPGRRIRGREAAAILKRVLDHLIMVWPKTKITLRGDSHFSTPEVHDLCDGYGIDFILGQAINKKLKALGEPLMELRRRWPSRPMNRCGSLTASTIGPVAGAVRAQIIYKAEITEGKANPRFVVTNIRNRTPKFLYEKGNRSVPVGVLRNVRKSCSHSAIAGIFGQWLYADLREEPSGETSWHSGFRRRLAADAEGGAAPRHVAVGGSAASEAVGTPAWPSCSAAGAVVMDRRRPTSRRHPARAKRRAPRRRVAASARRAARQGHNPGTKGMGERCCRWSRWTRWCRSSPPRAESAATP